MIIGICGGSGSGKTTLLRRLSEVYKHLNPSVFSMDNYYLPIDQQHIDENGKVNFDLPEALDEKLLTNDLNKLISGEAIEVREYHFNAPPDKSNFIRIEPSELIIVEGLFLFHYEKVRSVIDFSIFISVEPETQLFRRIERDMKTRGYTKEDIMYQWNFHVLPCFHNYLEPYKELADFNYRNDTHSESDFQLLINEIDKRLEKQTVMK